jgi:hypothetical protein
MSQLTMKGLPPEHLLSDTSGFAATIDEAFYAFYAWWIIFRHICMRDTRAVATSISQGLLLALKACRDVPSARAPDCGK